MTHSGLWAHQARVFDLLMADQNVILRAPTGAGKTRAALYPFLYSLDKYENYHNRLPNKCIYSVPMRILATQFHTEWEKTTARYANQYHIPNVKTAIQTGTQPHDREFAANLIFATIDQTLSSFLVAPYSQPRRLANLNAGAVLSAYLVFDEFHLYDPASTLPTTLEMLKLLNGITPFVLMTATFSQTMLDALAAALNAQIVGSSEEDLTAFQTLESQQKTRRYHAVEEPLTAERVLHHHHVQNGARRSLVVCNTVDRARALFERIRARKDAADEVHLLHSRFLPEDRSEKEAMLRQRFGKGDPSGGSLILVATQAVEVGVDITSQALHTELAPANAIIQRAGRCARYPGDEGDVFLYRHTYDADGEPVDLFERPAPYMSQDTLFPTTFEAFQGVSGEALDFAGEQAILSAVHGAQDAALIKQLEMTESEHRSHIFAAMRGDGDAHNLIRNIVSQAVIIHPEPEALLDDLKRKKRTPYDLPAFGLHPGTVQGYLAGRKNPDTGEREGGWLDRAFDLDLEWGVKYLHEFDRDQIDRDNDEANEDRFKWEAVVNAKTARGQRLLVINPALASYDPELGFVADRGGSWPELSLEARPDGKRADYTYRLETYERHIALVYAAFEDFWPEAAWAARRLEQQYGWAAGSVRRAAELAVLLHDVGKLTTGWQGWVQKYQREIGEPVAGGQAYAHTKSQNDEHKEAARRVGKRPWHAVEGAVAVMQVLGELIPETALLRAVISAIARHHTPTAGEYKRFKLVNGAQQHIHAGAQPVGIAFDRAQFIMEMQPNPGIKQVIAAPRRGWNREERAAFWAYLLIVRALRRADQYGTSVGSKGGTA